MSSNLVKKFYQDVLEHLFEQSAVLFEEEGLEESSMSDLRQLWESKLAENGIDLSRGAATADHPEPAPAKTGGRVGAKSKNSQQNKGDASSASTTAKETTGGRKAKSKAKPAVVPPAQHQQPSPEPEPEPEPVVHQPPPTAVQAQPPSAMALPAPSASYEQMIANSYLLNNGQQQHQIIRQQQSQQQHQHHHQKQQQQHQVLLSQQHQNRQSQNPTPSLNSNNMNTNNMPTISLLPYSVPISGPVVHISSVAKVPDGRQPQRQQPHPNNHSGMQAASRNPGGVSVQQLLLAAGNQRMGNHTGLPVGQQQQQQHYHQAQRIATSAPTMAPQGITLEDRHRLLDHIQNQMFRTQQQQQPSHLNSSMVNVSTVHQQQDVGQKFRQQNGGVILGNQQQNPYTNVNNLFLASQYGSFQQQQQPPMMNSQSSVIHVADSSGNQSALLLPVMQPGNVNHAMGNHPGGRGAAATGGIRKPGQLPVQLDGGDDDDDDDDDIFQDLSDDDDDTSSKATLTPRPAKKQKTGDRRDATERLEEEDLDSDDDDDNDDNTANAVDAVDNVVVCQYEKIGRTRNKWKLQLKSGMCSLNGKEYVFHKATGDAEF